MNLKLGTYKIRTNGRGSIITIPIIGLESLHVGNGDSVDLHLQDDAILITKTVQIHPVFAGIVTQMRGTK